VDYGVENADLNKEEVKRTALSVERMAISRREKAWHGRSFHEIRDTKYAIRPMGVSERLL
jgi:hypothetical protein